MNTLKTAITLIPLSCLLVACGGGGGGGNDSQPPNNPPNGGGNQKPTVTISAPSAGNVTGVELGISGNASDTDGSVQRVKIKVMHGTSVVFDREVNSANFNETWSLSNIEDGSYTVEAIATDDDNADSDSATVNIMVDNSNFDVDGDGWTNGDEESCLTDPFDGNDIPEDTDGDQSCNAIDADDDNDGDTDTEEQACGSDPLDENSTCNSVSNNPPTASIDTPTSNSTVSGFSVSIEGTGNDTEDSTVSVSIVITGPSGYIHSIDTTTNASGNYLATWLLVDNQTLIVPDGAFTITVIATDSNNTQSTPSVANVTVDNSDVDGDGWTNVEENNCGSDPFDAGEDCNSNAADLDRDLWTNGDEIACGTDPVDPKSYPFDTDNDGNCNALDPDPAFEYVQLSEYGVLNNELATKQFVIEASITGNVVECLKFRLSRPPSGPLLNEITVCDNGQNGDAVAGDNLFTKVFSLGISPLTLKGYDDDGDGNGELDIFFAGISLYDSSNNLVPLSLAQYESSPNIQIAITKQGNLVTPTQYSDNIWYTPHVVNVVVPPTYRGTDIEALRDAVGSYCSMFPGTTFDSIIVENYYRSLPELVLAAGYAIRVSNDVQGIGIGVFDNSAFFGCPGLKSILIITGSDRTGQVIPHEFAHTVAVGFNHESLQLTYTKVGGSVSGWSRSHWGHSTLDGQLATGYLLQDQGNGTLRVVSHINSPFLSQFNNWTLYALGWLQPQSITQPEWFVTVPGTFVDLDVVFSQGDPAVRSVIIQDVIANPNYGPRIPAQGNTSVRIGTIVISEERISDVEFAIEEVKSAHYEGTGSSQHPFTPPSLNDAAQGLGNFVTLLPAVSPASVETSRMSGLNSKVSGSRVTTLPLLSKEEIEEIKSHLIIETHHPH